VRGRVRGGMRCGNKERDQHSVTHNGRSVLFAAIIDVFLLSQ